jgi:hypothetical protein
MVSQNPRNGYAYRFAGRAWLGLGKIEAKPDIKKTDLEKAHAALVMAIKLTPLNYEAYYYMILDEYESNIKEPADVASMWGGGGEAAVLSGLQCTVSFSKPAVECGAKIEKILDEAWEARRKVIMIEVDQEDEEEDDYKIAIGDLAKIDKRFEKDDSQLRGQEIPPCPRNYLRQDVPSGGTR